MLEENPFQHDIEIAERELAIWKAFNDDQLNTENLTYSRIITELRLLSDKYPMNKMAFFKLIEPFVQKIQINLKILTDKPLFIKKYTVQINAFKHKLRIVF